MDNELLKEIGIINEDGFRVIEYAQKCVDIYEKTLIAMGLVSIERISETIENSKIYYNNPIEIKDQYANISRDY